MSTATTAPFAASSLRDLLETRASSKEITQYLDALPPHARVNEVLGITGKGVGRLYNAMASAPAVTFDELIPPDHKGTIIYEGRNSLPMFSRFQKRFARLSDGTIVGYNHQSMSFATGPGYFIVKPATGQGDHADEIVFDYTVAPPYEPDGWPRYKPNDSGLSRSVYGNLMDYMRRVARGVVVGKAYKLGVDQHAYFSLSREV